MSSKFVVLRWSLTLPLFLVLASCGSNGSEEDKILSLDVDQFMTYEIDIHSKPISFFDLVEEVEIVRLEETPESLLSFVNELSFAEDLMVFPGGRGDLYVYKNDGSFVEKINRQGRGPEEYSYINQFWVDDAINVYDAQMSSIQRYSLSGTYLGSKSLPYNGDFLYPMNGGGYALDRNLKVEDTLNFNLVILDSELKKMAAVNPFQEDSRTKTVTTGAKSLAPYKDGLLYQKNMTDTIFLLNSTSLKPLLTYDFGKDWVWTNEAITSDRLAIRNATMDGTLVWNTKSKIDSDHIFLRFTGGSKLFRYVLIDRSTRVNKLIDLRKSPEVNFGISPVQWDKGRLIIRLKSTDLNEFLSELDNGQYKLRDGTTIEEIESSENPVLVWIKFK